MKKIVAIFIFTFLCLFCNAQNDYSIRDLKAGKFKADSSYVYALPYQKGRAYFLIQAYDSKMSHKGEYALDFKMQEGTTVCAARKGVVVSMKEDSQKGGLKPEMLSEGNYIIIEHEDGTQSMYWHLQFNGVFVNAGDTVKQGQQIGYSGNTGYSAFPHLHFEVQEPSKGQVPTRFSTTKGVRYLRPGKWHKAI